MAVELKEKSLQVTKEMSELGDMLVAPTKALIEAYKDDQNISSEEALGVVTSSVDELLAGLQGVDKLGDELEQHLNEAIDAMVVSVLEIKKELLKLAKKPAPEAPSSEPPDAA